MSKTLIYVVKFRYFIERFVKFDSLVNLLDLELSFLISDEFISTVIVNIIFN